MSPLLFVVLLGLLAGLVLFVVVVGVGALFNAVLNRIPAKDTKRARQSAPEEVQSDAAEETEPTFEPAPEMQLAAAAPVVSVQEQAERAEPVPAVAYAARSFPKRPAEAEEVQPEVVESEPIPVELEPEVQPEPEDAAVSEPEEAPVAAEAAVTEREARPRRKFPRPASKAVSAAPAAAQEPVEVPDEPEQQDEPEAVQQPAADAVDPFAAVMAVLNNKR